MLKTQTCKTQPRIASYGFNPFQLVQYKIYFYVSYNVESSRTQKPVKAGERGAILGYTTMTPSIFGLGHPRREINKSADVDCKLWILFDLSPWLMIYRQSFKKRCSYWYDNQVRNPSMHKLISQKCRKLGTVNRNPVTYLVWVWTVSASPIKNIFFIIYNDKTSKWDRKRLRPAKALSFSTTRCTRHLYSN